MSRFVFLLMGGALLIYLIFQLGPQQIFSTLLRIGWNFLLVGFIFGTSELIRAGALFQCVLSKEEFSYWDILWIRISGEAVRFLTFTGPFLAEPFKALLLKRRGLTTRGAFAAAITEYLIYTFTSASISLAGLIYIVRHFALPTSVYTGALIIIVLAAVFLIVSAVAIWFRWYLIGTVVTGIARLPVLRSRFKLNIEEVHRMEDLLLVILRERPTQLLKITSIELVAQCLLVFEVYWILKAMNLSFPVLYAFLIEAAGKFVSLAFFFVPWQIGVTEGTYVVILNSLGLLAAAGFTLAFVRRLRSLMIVAVGLVSIWLLTGRRHSAGAGA